MSTSRVLLYTEENGGNTHFRIDSDTLEIVADATSANASVFIRTTESGSRENTYQWADNPSLFMAMRSDSVIVVIETNTPGPETIFTSGSAKDGDRPDDYYLLAENGLMITRNTSNSVMVATGNPDQDPTPKNSIIEASQAN